MAEIVVIPPELQGNDGFAPYFETVIRYLGGLLSAYALSKDHILLERAEDLAVALDPIFDTPSGMPFYSVNPTTYVLGLSILASNC